MSSFCSFFFFQAEDGIRDRDVTGVQTCALPISLGRGEVAAGGAAGADLADQLDWLARADRPAAAGPVAGGLVPGGYYRVRGQRPGDGGEGEALVGGAVQLEGVAA